MNKESLLSDSQVLFGQAKVERPLQNMTLAEILVEYSRRITRKLVEATRIEERKKEEARAKLDFLNKKDPKKLERLSDDLQSYSQNRPLYYGEIREASREAAKELNKEMNRHAYSASQVKEIIADGDPRLFPVTEDIQKELNASKAKAEQNENSPMAREILHKRTIQDARNAHVIKGLSTVDEVKLRAGNKDEQAKVRTIAEDLTRIAISTEYTSEPALEAKSILRDLKKGYQGIPDLSEDLEELQELTAPVLVGGSGRTGHNFTDPIFDKIDLTVLPPEIANPLSTIQKLIDVKGATEPKYRSPFSMDQYVKELEAARQQYAYNNPKVPLNEDQITALVDVDTKLQGVISAQQQAAHEDRKNREFSRFSLSTEQEEQFFQSPDKIYTNALYELYQPRYVEEAAGQQKLVDQYGDWVGTFHFEEGYKNWFKDQPGHSGLTDRDLKRSYDEYYAKVTKLREEFSLVRNLKYAATQLEKGKGDIKSYKDIVGDVGDKGWQMAAKQGLAGSAYNMLTGLAYEEQIKTTDGELTRIEPGGFDRARKRVEQIMKDRRAYFTQRYNNLSISRGEAPLSEGVQLTDQQIHYFAQVAHAMAVVRQRQEIAMLKGAGPFDAKKSPVKSLYGDVINLPAAPFANAGAVEARLATFNFYDFLQDKYKTLGPGQLRQVMHAAGFAAIDMGYEDEMRIEIAQMKKDGVYLQKRDEAITKQWGEHLERYPKAGRGRFEGKFKIGLDRPGAPTSLNMDRFDRDREFENILLFEKGKYIFGELLEMYDHDSSGFRGISILAQVNRMWEDSDTIGLGYWLKRAADGFTSNRGHELEEIFMHGMPDELADRQKYIGDVPGWEHGLSVHNVLKKIGEYRPQFTALALDEQKNADFQAWWQNDGQGLATDMMSYGDSKARFQNDVFMKAYSFAQERFIAMNEQLAQEGLGVINYSHGEAGLSSEQRRIVNTVLEGFSSGVPGFDTEGARAGYMNFMEHLSEISSKESSIHQFKKIGYRKYLKRNQFTDDARLDMLETPDMLKAYQGNGHVKADAAKVEAYSENVAPGGVGGNSLLARTYGDFATAQELVGAMGNAFGPDRETVLKTLKQIKDVEINYTGKVNGIRAAAYLVASYGKMAESTNPLVNFVNGDDFFYNTSEFKLFFDSHHSPSFQLNEQHELIEQVNGIMSKMELYDTGMAETVHEMERYLGIKSRYGLFGSGLLKDSSYPMYGHRAKLVVAIAAGIIALDVLSQGMGELGYEKKESAGQHH